MIAEKILVISEEPADARVLEDLLRTYFPGIVPGHVLPGLGAAMPSPRDMGTLSLEVSQREEKAGGFVVSLGIKGKIYKGQSHSSGLAFYEEKTNRQRRLLRLAVHQALRAYLADAGCLVSPWGILTGVRPEKVVHRLEKQGFLADEINRILVCDYGIQQEKASLAIKVAGIQAPYLAKIDPWHQVSIYAAVPFCPSRCHYCSFPAFDIKRWGYLLESYLENLQAEIKAVAAALSGLGLKVQTLYLGGGTPTVLSAGQLARLLDLLFGQFEISSDREVTVEAGRPDTLDREKLQTLKAFGVNRISINPQTFHEDTLALIGRGHGARDIADAYEAARAFGFPVVNMDLIVGLPGENRQILKASIERVISLRPENITLHDLALKRGAYYKEAGVDLPEPGEGARMTFLAQQALETAGYQPYYLYRQKEILAHGENVGYCLPGTASLYNILMMEEKQTILGLGVGAGSKIYDPVKESIDNFYNPKDLKVYEERLEGIIQRKVDKLRSFLYNNCK